MFQLQRSRYRTHGILIIGICVLLLSALPAQITQAVPIPREINNALADFKDGQFQRTSLANVTQPSSGGIVADQRGGVQLGPVGMIKAWIPGKFTLPKSAGRDNARLYRMGATAFGSRIFIVGGFNPTGIGAGTQRLKEVWSVGVSTLDGALLGSGWDREPDLPAVQGSVQGADGSSPNFTAAVAEIASPAVTSVSDAAGLNGYIYVIGGNAAIGNFDFSSFAVRIATVTNGRIAGWVPLTAQEAINLRIPSTDPNNPFIPPRGVQQASAVTAQVGGKTYVYLIGGLQRYISGGKTVSEGLKTVFYARVGAGGKLYKPSTTGDTVANEGWERNLGGTSGDIPAPGGSPAGLYDASVVADNFVASTQAAANAIYAIGGQITPSSQESGQQVPASYSEKVYRALINSNGSLNWGGWQGVLLSPRSQASGIPFRGNIYMAGGIPNGGAAESVVLTSYVEDDLTLHQFINPPPGVLGNNTNFLQSDPADNILTKPRKLHGSVLVRAGADSPNSAFLYVLGGIGAQDSDNTDDNGADTVLYGKIGGGEDVSTTGYASDGWYYGQPVDVAQQFSQVQLQEIDWTTVVTRTTANMDIALDYRLSTSNNCTNATWGGWTPLHSATADASHASSNARNYATINNQAARCFQYRAHLTTADALATPLLLNVSVMVEVPGSPDLKLASLTAQRGLNNIFLGLNVVIENKNLIEPPTLAADAEKKGSFYVDLCIFKPGVTPVKPTLPLPNPPTNTCSTVYANVNRIFLPANDSYVIPQWKDTKTNQIVSLTKYFTTPGTYNVIVVIDSLNNVNEGNKGGESNNVPNAIPITVNKVGFQLSVPLLSR